MYGTVLCVEVILIMGIHFSFVLRPGLESHNIHNVCTSGQFEMSIKLQLVLGGY